MKESVGFGMNKTPTQIKPGMTAKMSEGYDEFPPHAEDSTVTALLSRIRLVRMAAAARMTAGAEAR